MDVRTSKVTISTSTAGAFTQSVPAGGARLLHAVYQGALTAASDLLITDALTGMTLLSAANFGSTLKKTWTPRRLINNAANGTESTSVFDTQAVNQSVTVAISGSTAGVATGTLYLVFG